MTDTTNLHAAFEAWAAKDEPPYKLERAPDPYVYAWGSTACAWEAFQAGAAHAVAQRQGEPVAWMSTVMCLGPDYGKVRFDKLPIQSLQEGYYSHTPLYTAPATAEQPAEPNREPNNEEVICPACTHQFRAIPVQVQRLLLDAGIEPPFLTATAPAPATTREVTDAEIDALVPERTPMDRFENAIREVGVVAACEWFGHSADSEFTKLTIRVLDERAAIALANGRGGA